MPDLNEMPNVIMYAIIQFCFNCLPNLKVHITMWWPTSILGTYHISIDTPKINVLISPVSYINMLSLFHFFYSIYEPSVDCWWANVNNNDVHLYTHASITKQSKLLWLKLVYMWQDQGEWVTCRQYSILIFFSRVNYLSNYNTTFWFKPYPNQTWL